MLLDQSGNLFAQLVNICVVFYITNHVVNYLLNKLNTPEKSIIITFEGNISSGKSTWISTLAKVKGIIPTYERISSDLLQLFYSNPSKYAFTLQCLTQIRRNCELNYNYLYKSFKANGSTIIHDRGLFGDLCFALIHYGEGNMNQKEMDAYSIEAKLENIVLNNSRIDKIIYLHSTPERCKNAVLNRGDVDKGVPIEYLTKLDELHFHGIIYLILKGMNISVVDWTNFGFVNDNPKAVEQSYGQLKKALSVRHHIYLAGDKRTIEPNTVIIDYADSLIDLPVDYLPKLDKRYQRVISPKVKATIVEAFGNNKTVTLTNMEDSLLDLFHDLPILFKSSV